MPERIYKLQPNRTLYLRGFDSFAAAASIHNATATGFQISGIFRDPADFAVAVLYDVDNAFEHPSIKYLPDFNFAGLTLTFSLLYTDTLQPIDSPKFNWIDWATLDCVLEDGSTANKSLIDHAMLADATFPAATGTLNVTGTGAQPNDSLSLWYENLFFDYTVPGGLIGSATYFFQNAPSTASISVGSTTYTYNVTTAGGESGSTIAAGLKAKAAADPQVAFSVSGGVLSFFSKVNTGGAISVSGYFLWLITDPPSVFIANNIAEQINGCDWAEANTPYGLLAVANTTAIAITAAQYGAVDVSGTSVAWVSGTKFSGIAPGSAITIAGQVYTVASVQSPLQLTLTPTPSAPASSNVPYLAPRGGRDGNMIRFYTLASSPSNLSFDQPQLQLAGGNSTVTWNCCIDFTLLGIDSLRQCWLTFAPSLADGAAFTPAEWQATFSNWQLTGPDSIAALQVAGPGSVRIEEDSAACTFTSGWNVESGFYSQYFAKAASLPNESVTITYTCQLTHNLYIGTSLDGTTAQADGLALVTDTLYNPSLNNHLYSDRGIAGVQLDGETLPSLDCRVNTTGSELVTRRLLKASVAAGKHTVVISVQQAGTVYFDFLEAAVLSDVPDALPPRSNISPALDFDTDQTYKLAPARLMWMLHKMGYAGPMNEYLGVFWWNERAAVGGSVSTALVTFGGTFVSGDWVILQFDPAGGGAQLRKTVSSSDTPTTIALHFAAYINGSLTSSWASAAAGALTITGRSPALPYNLVLAVTVHSTLGTAPITPALPALPPAGVSPAWVIDDTVSPPLNRAARDWHADFYSQCAALGLHVVTSCSMELVNPPDGYAALFPDLLRTPVTTQTGFGALSSTQCAVGSSKLLAYQKAVYRNIAQMQLTAGLTPSVQYGEFLWWYFAGPGGMAYYDDETKAAAQAALGRPLQTFLTPNDDPTVNLSADAVFLRNRLRDYVAALVSDIRSAFPTVACEVLWPYDVNYPVPSGGEGGQLNRFINLPVEWQLQSSSGLDTMKVEALTFATSQRDLNLAREAIDLFPSFGWPLSALRYLVPVFGSLIRPAPAWTRELAMVWAAGIPVANFWAFDHICLYNLEVPEPPLDRRSVVKTS